MTNHHWKLRSPSATSAGRRRANALGPVALADLARHPRHQRGLAQRRPAGLAELEERSQLFHATLEPPPRQRQSEIQGVQLGVSVRSRMAAACAAWPRRRRSDPRSRHQAVPHVPQAEVLGLLDLPARAPRSAATRRDASKSPSSNRACSSHLSPWRRISRSPMRSPRSRISPAAATCRSTSSGPLNAQYR